MVKALLFSFIVSANAMAAPKNACVDGGAACGGLDCCFTFGNTDCCCPLGSHCVVFSGSYCGSVCSLPDVEESRTEGKAVEVIMVEEVAGTAQAKPTEAPPTYLAHTAVVGVSKHIEPVKKHNESVEQAQNTCVDGGAACPGLDCCFTFGNTDCCCPPGSHCVVFSGSYCGTVCSYID